MPTNHAAKQTVTVKVLNKKLKKENLLFCFFIASCLSNSERASSKAFTRNDVICILYTQTKMYFTCAVPRNVRHRTPRSAG